MRAYGPTAATVFAALLALSSIATAKDLPAGGLTRGEVLQWLQSKGLKAKLDHDAVAKDDTVTVDAGDLTWSVYFYGCSNDRCKSMQYAANWKGETISIDQVNRWNAGRRFIRAYKTASGYLFGEYDVDVSPGGSWELVDYSLERWQTQIPLFAKFLKTGKLPK